MKTQGIRISDTKNNVLDVKISDILKEILNGPDLNWCILFIDGTPAPDKEDIVHDHINKVNKSKDGFTTNWKDLCLIGNEFHQIYETTILASKNRNFLHRYNNDEQMYQSCDIVIELIDCAFWQVFSKKSELIEKLVHKFRDIELLQPNFEK